jgi:hypothetical protein
MNEITDQASGHGGAITVEVHPGGALSSLTLSDKAIALGARTLAASILDTVAEATALANQRTKHALRAALPGLGERELTVLGLDRDTALTERVETPTPQTWRL